MSGLSKLNKPSKYIENPNDNIDENKPKSGLGKIKEVSNNQSKYGVGQTELIKIIDAMIVREEEISISNRSPRSGRFNPSSLGETCDRLLYLSYNGMLLPENNRDAANLRRLSNGHSLEARFFGYFLKLNIYRQQEKRIEIFEPPMSGRVDFIVQLPDREYQSIIELKTINDKGFSNLKAPKPEHGIQLQCYLNMMNMPHGIVLYENKNTQDFKEFHVLQDNDIWQKIVERCERIQNMQDIPDVPKTGHSRFCGCRAYGK